MKQFPGMNPYMEYPYNWRGFHTILAAAISEHLTTQIYPAYVAQMEVYSILEGVNVVGRSGAYPDVSIFENEIDADFIQPGTAVITKPSLRVTTLVEADTAGREILIRTTDTREVVTAIEILSPANKSGAGLTQYIDKRNKILRSDAHLIEIDLLRGGSRVIEEVDKPIDTDYVLLVSQSESPRYSDIWKVALNESLPTIPVPLRFPDPNATLNMMEIIEIIYQRYHYDAIPDYSQPPPPPRLRPAMKKWWQEQFGETV